MERQFKMRFITFYKQSSNQQKQIQLCVESLEYSE